MPSTTVSDDTKLPVLLVRADVWHARMRERNCVTGVEQALAVGCARSALIDVLSGKAEPRRDLARRMARAAGVSPDVLFKVADA